MTDKVLAHCEPWFIPATWENYFVQFPDFNSALKYPTGFPKYAGEIGRLGDYRVIVSGKKT